MANVTYARPKMSQTIIFFHSSSVGTAAATGSRCVAHLTIAKLTNVNLCTHTFTYARVETDQRWNASCDKQSGNDIEFYRCWHPFAFSFSIKRSPHQQTNKQMHSIFHFVIPKFSQQFCIIKCIEKKSKTKWRRPGAGGGGKGNKLRYYTIDNRRMRSAPLREDLVVRKFVHGSNL